jgi:hypothetical protein
MMMRRRRRMTITRVVAWNVVFVSPSAREGSGK